MKRFAIILTGLLCLFIAAGLILPAVAQFPKQALVLYTIGILLAVTGLIAVFKGTFRRRTLER
jgi:hypothetical protein